jgi:hypothetical protein
MFPKRDSFKNENSALIVDKADDLCFLNCRVFEDEELVGFRELEKADHINLITATVKKFY